MFKPPLKEHVPGSDFEQILQAYEQGYETHRRGKPYVNPWKRSSEKYDLAGYPIQSYLIWENELNRWFYLGYFDWKVNDWVPYLSDDQQSEHAVNPETGKSKKSNIPWNGDIRSAVVEGYDANFVVAFNALPRPMVATQ